MSPSSWCNAVAAVLLLTLAKAKCDQGPRVIIVGAGAAGIAAAVKLLENNYTDIMVLEAEDRIGGRIYSVDFGDAIVDLGAAWCHGETGNVVYEMVKDLDLLGEGELTFTIYHSSQEIIDEDLKNELYNYLHVLYIDDKKEGKEDSLGSYIIPRYMEKIIESFKDDPAKLTFATELLHFYMKVVLWLDGAFSTYEVAARSDFKECSGKYALNWKGRGYHTILDILLKRFPNETEEMPVAEKVFFSKKVVGIVWDDMQEDLTITCSDGSSYVADHVIFTPSLGVLKATSKVLFYPSLPAEKARAIKTLGMGAVLKVFLHFPIRWWPEENFTDISFLWSKEDEQLVLQQFLQGPSQNGKSWLLDLLGVFIVENNPNVLVAWFSGDMVPKIEDCSDKLISDGVMFVLNKFVGLYFDNITKPDAIARHNWYSNRNFYGTYSFQAVTTRKGELSDEAVLAQPLTSRQGKPKLLFAGEATHPVYYSTVHGAIETGNREANNIINYYKEL